MNQERSQQQAQESSTTSKVAKVALMTLSIFGMLTGIGGIFGGLGGLGVTSLSAFLIDNGGDFIDFFKDQQEQLGIDQDTLQGASQVAVSGFPQIPSYNIKLSHISDYINNMKGLYELSDTQKPIATIEDVQKIGALLQFFGVNIYRTENGLFRTDPHIWALTELGKLGYRITDEAMIYGGGMAARAIPNARSGYHRERRFTLKLISAFQLVTTYNSRIKLPGYFELHPEGALNGEESALVELGRRISILGGVFYQFAEGVFKEHWQEKTKFYPNMIDKMEHFFKYSRLLSTNQRQIAITAIETYRQEMGYFTQSGTSTTYQEYNLAKYLQYAISSQLGRYVNFNEMAIMFKGRKTDGTPKQDDFFRRRIHSATRMRFSTRTVKDLLVWVNNPIQWEISRGAGQGVQLTQNQIQLAGPNLRVAQTAIFSYYQQNWVNSKTSYIVDQNAANKDELEIFEILRAAYSRHPQLNPNFGRRDISQKTLSERILGKKRTFDRILNNNFPISTRLLSYIYNKVRADLIQWHAPQEYSDLIRALNRYNLQFREYWRRENMMYTNLRLAPATNRYPSSWTPNMKRMQREMLSIWFAGRDAYTGDPLLTAAHLHHWQVTNPLNKRDCSLYYDLSRGRLPALVPLSPQSHGIVGINPMFEQEFREILLSVLKGRPSRRWSLQNKKDFVHDRWVMAQRIVNHYT